MNELIKWTGGWRGGEIGKGREREGREMGDGEGKGGRWEMGRERDGDHHHTYYPFT